MIQIIQTQFRFRSQTLFMNQVIHDNNNIVCCGTIIIWINTVTIPKIKDFEPEIHACEGEQVTLRVNFIGTPKPTITWTFKGKKVEGDYATELGSDGSLLFVCVEGRHAGR